MKVHELMTRKVASCRPEMSLAAAGALMWQNDCGILPITAESGKVIGMLTDRDICIALSTRAGNSSSIAAGNVAQPQVFVCQPDDDIHTAMRTMRTEKVHRLPVVDEAGTLVGILSLNNIVLRAEKSDVTERPDLSYDDVVHTLQGIGAHLPRHHAAVA
jgi:CBS domain-containing protein